LSHLQPLIGLLAFIAFAVLCSEQRRLPPWKLLVAGLGLQFLFALLVFRIDAVQQVLYGINAGVAAIANASEAGSLFVFGYLGGDPAKVAYPFSVEDPGATMVLAFRILPLILFFTVLSSILWYFRILPLLVRGFSLLLQRSLKVGGAVALCSAANVFMGMVESPTLIRPYLRTLTRSELFLVMSVGMSTIAGSVMVLYSVILQDLVENALGHILTASVISAPAAIMLALIMVPADGETSKDEVELRIQYHNLMDAIAKGTADGLKLMVNVGAMLLVLVALVALVNSALTLLPDVGGTAVTLQRLFAIVFAPLAWLMGIPWQEAGVAGSLMGTKTVLNELLAYLAMAELPAGSLSENSTLIMTYAICGFANFGSLGIMIGGLSGMCPDRARETVTLAPRSLISGTLATCMTGTVAGLLL
jgi:CNT family concentrative nucleoside transporter